MKTLIAAAALALLATPAFAAPTVPDGTYACTLEGAAVGDIKLAGDQYQGPAVDGAFGDSAMWITMDPDRIEWMGDLGVLTEQGYRIDHTVIVETGFVLTLLKPDQSGFVDATCARL